METESRWRVSPASAAIPGENTAELLGVAPWRTIWFSPRLTVRALIESRTAPNWPAAILCAVGLALRGAVFHAPTASPLDFPELLIRFIFTSGLVAYVVALGPMVVHRYAKNAHGKGNARTNRVALTWSFVPAAASMLPGIPVWMAAGGGDNRIAVLSFLTTTALAWSAVLAVATVAEAERISRWQAFQCLITLAVTTLILGVVLSKALGA